MNSNSMDPDSADMVTQDRHALFLLVSLLVFLVLSAFINEGEILSEVILLVSMYVTFIAATLELSGKTMLRRPVMLLAGSCMLITLLHFLHPVHALLVANWLLQASFFGFVSVALFLYLGRPGSIRSGRIYASVSLYLMLGIFYCAIFNLLEALHPGSFTDQGARISRHSLLYFSLVTLTTLGYGDVVPILAPARMFAALEAITGVFYIAITVARLVAGYRGSTPE